MTLCASAHRRVCLPRVFPRIFLLVKRSEAHPTSPRRRLVLCPTLKRSCAHSRLTFRISLPISQLDCMRTLFGSVWIRTFPPLLASNTQLPPSHLHPNPHGFLGRLWPGIAAKLPEASSKLQWEEEQRGEDRRWRICRS